MNFQRKKPAFKKGGKWVKLSYICILILYFAGLIKVKKGNAVFLFGGFHKFKPKLNSHLNKRRKLRYDFCYSKLIIYPIPFSKKKTTSIKKEKINTCYCSYDLYPCQTTCYSYVRIVSNYVKLNKRCGSSYCSHVIAITEKGFSCYPYLLITFYKSPKIINTTINFSKTCMMT